MGLEALALAALLGHGRAPRYDRSEDPWYRVRLRAAEVLGWSESRALSCDFRDLQVRVKAVDPELARTMTGMLHADRDRRKRRW